MWLKLVVVGLKSAPGHKPKAAEVFLRYSVNESPCQVQDQALSQFCLPLGPENQTPKEFMAPEEFTFTLTQGDGSRLQGFCRRFLPPAARVGSKLRYPQVLCLVCEASWANLFFKVLEVTEQLLRQTDLLFDFSNRELPPSSLAGAFLSNLGEVLAQQPPLGSVVRVQLPRISIPLAMSPPKRIGGTAADGPLPLLLTEEFIELQVPPDIGNGRANAGVSLARLLWHVPVPAMLTLIASLLLERRVLVVGQSRDMVSAAVCAAQALIHPFRWHHIFLPLLPRSLADYLTAPMPFLIGLPAQLLPALKNMPMDEITLIDLDLGKCEPAPGSARDDAAMLPWRDQLEGALHAAFSLLKSPTEQESNPVIASIMHGYFLKLLGTCRNHMYPEGAGPGSLSSPGTPQPASLSNIASLIQGGRPGHQRSRSASPLHGGNSSGALAAFAAAAGGGSAAGQPPLARMSLSAVGGGGAAGSSLRQSRASSSNISRADEGLAAHGFWYDHSGMVASHRRNEKARNFLTLLRQSQLFEVFIRERLQMYAQVEGGPEYSGDDFEQLVNTYLDNRSRRLTARLGAGVRSSLSRFGALIKKHRRTATDTTQGLPSSLSMPAVPSPALSGPGNSRGGSREWAPGGAASGGVAAGLMSGLRGLAGPDRPEALRMRQLVGAFAAAADQMRRNLIDGDDSRGAAADSTASGRAPATSVGTTPDRCSPAPMDPSAFFEDDEEELEAEAAEAAAAAANSSNANARLSRSSLSSNNLKELGTAPLVAPSGASWTAGGSSSSKSGPIMPQQPLHSGLAGLSNSVQQHQGMIAGGGGGGSNNSSSSSPALHRHSVPAVMMAHSPDRPASPAPLIDLSGGSSSTDFHGSNTGSAAPAAASGVAGLSSSTPAQQHRHQHQQQQQHFGYLEHLQQPQKAPQQVSPRSPNSAAPWLQQQYQRPPPHGTAGGAQRTSQHINVKAALASIPAGPLPQPPQPRSRSSSANAASPTALQQQQQLQPAGPVVVQQLAHQTAATSAVVQSRRSTDWDPFAELLTERIASFSTDMQQQQQQHQKQQQSVVLMHAAHLADSSDGQTSSGCANSSSGRCSVSTSAGGSIAEHSVSSQGSFGVMQDSNGLLSLHGTFDNLQNSLCVAGDNIPSASGRDDLTAAATAAGFRFAVSEGGASTGMSAEGASKLQQAFAQQQFMMQRSSAGDDLL